MAVALYHSLETSAATGTTITQANSATGVTDGSTPFNQSNIGTGCVMQYSTAQFRAGTRSMISSTGTTATTVFAGWGGFDVSGSDTVYARAYVRVTARSSVATRLIELRSATTRSCALAMTASGGIQCVDSNNTLSGTATNAIPLNTWIRVELAGTWGTGATDGRIEVRAYNGSTLIGSSVVSNADVAGDTGPISIARFGASAGGGSASIASIYFDDIAVSSVTWIGTGLPSTIQTFVQALSYGLSAAQSIAKGVAVTDIFGTATSAIQARTGRFFRTLTAASSTAALAAKTGQLTRTAGVTRSLVAGKAGQLTCSTSVTRSLTISKAGALSRATATGLAGSVSRAYAVVRSTSTSTVPAVVKAVRLSRSGGLFSTSASARRTGLNRTAMSGLAPSVGPKQIFRNLASAVLTTVSRSTLVGVGRTVLSSPTALLGRFVSVSRSVPLNLSGFLSTGGATLTRAFTYSTSTVLALANRVGITDLFTVVSAQTANRRAQLVRATGLTHTVISSRSAQLRRTLALSRSATLTKRAGMARAMGLAVAGWGSRAVALTRANAIAVSSDTGRLASLTLSTLTSLFPDMATGSLVARVLTYSTSTAAALWKRAQLVDTFGLAVVGGALRRAVLLIRLAALPRTSTLAKGVRATRPAVAVVSPGIRKLAGIARATGAGMASTFSRGQAAVTVVLSYALTGSASFAQGFAYARTLAAGLTAAPARALAVRAVRATSTILASVRTSRTARAFFVLLSPAAIAAKRISQTLPAGLTTAGAVLYGRALGLVFATATGVFGALRRSVTVRRSAALAASQGVRKAIQARRLVPALLTPWLTRAFSRELLTDAAMAGSSFRSYAKTFLAAIGSGLLFSTAQRAGSAWRRFTGQGTAKGSEFTARVDRREAKSRVTGMEGR